MNDENNNVRNYQIEKAGEYPVAFPVERQYQQEEEVHLRDYLQIILRRKWTVITFFLVVVTTVTIGTYMMRPIYRASVVIKIDKENPNVLKFKDVYEIERAEEDYYQTQYKILKSKNLARRVIRSLKLDANPLFVRKEGFLATGNKASNRDGKEDSSEGEIHPDIVEAFLNRVTVEPMQKSRLVKVSFDSYSPEMSADVANTIGKTLIDFNIESKFDATQHARDWMEKQLQEMKAKVESSEERLNEYAAKNGIIFVAEKNSQDTKDTQNIINRRLAELSTHLVQATSDRIGKEALYREIQGGDAEDSTVVTNNPLIQVLKKDYATMEAEYSQLSRVYKPDYPKMIRLREQMEQLKRRIDAEVNKIVSGIKKDYEAAVRRENYLINTMEKYKAEVLKLNEKMVQYQILKREADTNKELYNGLLQRLKETGISASLTASNIQILDRADIPNSPYKPKKTLNIFLSIIVGLFGGVGLAFFFEYLDNAIKTPEDIEKRVSMPYLGLVPDVVKSGKRGDNEIEDSRYLISHYDKTSPHSEAFRSIGTYIQFSTPVRPPRSILISSPRKEEGKTTIAVNTAVSLAQTSGRCIIVDADLRRPRLHRIFDVDNSTGLSSFLTGHIEFDRGLILNTKIGNLDIIPSGPTPPNPSELLTSSRMRDLLDGLFPLYSFILIDSPPVLGMSDSLVLSTMTEGVILVVRCGETPRDAAIQARKLLQGVNARILGVVLNGITPSDLKYGSYSYYYSYYYKDGYGDNEKRRSRRKEI